MRLRAHRVKTGISALLMAAQAFQADAAPCDVADPSVQPIRVVTTRVLSIGDVVSPSGSGAVVSVSPFGQRSMPLELDMNTRNREGLGDRFNAGRVVISGTAGCDFTIVATYARPVRQVSLAANPSTPVVFAASGPSGSGRFSTESFELWVGAAVELDGKVAPGALSVEINISASYQ